MSRTRFILCIHNHQPVGNFDSVVEEAYQRAYLPFLEVMENHSTLPWVLHNSGCLWEWLESHHTEYIDRIGRQVDSGRIELLGGGFYEPVLPALAPDDRREQILKMREYLKRRFGVIADGVWLTERVWEPDLPIDLAAAGVRYLPLDDTQLHQVGVAPERVRGHFVTESAGCTLQVFPALMKLRYQIPYAEAQEVVDFLCKPFPGGGEGLAVYADDGEKFGIWPGTYDLVYRKRWLERFLQTLEEAEDRIRLTTFASESLERSQGLIYLPAGSYAEMGQWALPPEFQAAHEKTRRQLEQAGMEREADLFIRGGFWRNFFARYPESSWMHMRSLEASRRCRMLEDKIDPACWRRARDHFWRAQCNCAYWHGVFGGLYLPHLRHGIYAELVRGETELARGLHGEKSWLDVRRADLDADGREELVLENDSLMLYCDPDEGGRLIEWDDRDAAINLVNVVARRPEFYHRGVADEETGDVPESAETIHGAILTREKGLRELLSYDSQGRACLVDRFFEDRPRAQDLRCGAVPDAGEFAGRPFQHEIEKRGDEITLRLWREGLLHLSGIEYPLMVEKCIRLRRGERGFDVRLRYRNLSAEPIQVWAAIENHINLLAGDAPDRWLAVNERKAHRPRLRATDEASDVRSLALVEGYLDWHVWFEIHPSVALRRYPVETVSLSEAGAERNYQGTALLFLTRLELAPDADHALEFSAGVRKGIPTLQSELAGGMDRVG